MVKLLMKMDDNVDSKDYIKHEGPNENFET